MVLRAIWTTTIENFRSTMGTDFHVMTKDFLWAEAPRAITLASEAKLFLIWKSFEITKK